MEARNYQMKASKDSFEITAAGAKQRQDKTKGQFSPPFEDVVLQESSIHTHTHRELSLVSQPKEEPFQHGGSPAKIRKKE